MAVVAIIVSVVSLDHYVSLVAVERKIPGDLRAFLQCMAFFGHGTGCLIAISLVWFLDRANKHVIPLIIGSVLMAGATTTVIKVIVHRPRPFVDPATVSDNITFNEAVFHNFLQSFPSGHTATAFALAMALSLAYNRGKPLFFTFAALVAIQRIITQNHFPSDVIAGAVIGILSTHAAFALSQRTQRSLRSADFRSSVSPSPIPVADARVSRGCDRKPNAGRISTV